MLSFTEENYLKALLKVVGENKTKGIGTNFLASHLGIKPASANEMLKKLKEKELINNEKYGKITLTALGKKHALEIVRKHRLWETFLYQKLSFSWDEVHEVAEQLEHIHSPKLIDKLDEFLGFPEFDPHGDPIPNTKGELKVHFKQTLSEIAVGESCKVASVADNSVAFLKYLDNLGMQINTKIKVVSKQEFDGMLEIEVEKKRIFVTPKLAESLLVTCNTCTIGKVCKKQICQEVY